MNITIHRATDRGKADYKWLKARYSFNFANYFDPKRERFGVLRVLNDNQIEGGGGFDTHPHNNMEIITIPLEGSLSHQDSMGNTSVIAKNEVQRMSAGSGITHSEYNLSDSETLNLLQIWIFPKTRNTRPSYSQINLAEKRENNRIQTIVSPDGGENILQINQDAWLSLLGTAAENQYNYQVHKPGNNIFLFVIEGALETGDSRAGRRDSIEIKGAGEISFTAKEKSEILIIEVPEE
ncbi:MAG: pirin family protein [Lentimicrobium sp.]